MNIKKRKDLCSLACEQYAEAGVDVDAALKKLARIPISLHSWQGDDVRGFDQPPGALTGGCQATGRYPGRARDARELRADMDFVFSLVGGRHRVNLQAFHAEFPGEKWVDRDELRTEHFRNWIGWAKQKGMGLDLNPTYFSHPKFDGFSLAHQDKRVRDFWIRHTIATRRIAADIGKELGTPCVNNVWIPDGYKDIPADRATPRRLLADALDTCFADTFPSSRMADALESKLFGIGVESYTVGSHEFYTSYAVKHQKWLTFDTGHFHPTESIADKLSAVLPFVPGIMLHVSRGVRWDSDHVVIVDDNLIALAQEIVRLNAFKRIQIGLDFFDASINRVAAWVIGMRAMQKALLFALLEPRKALVQAERTRDYTSRLCLIEAAKTLPFSIVWDMFCERENVPSDVQWLPEVRQYETNVLAKREE